MSLEIVRVYSGVFIVRGISVDPCRIMARLCLNSNHWEVGKRRLANGGASDDDFPGEDIFLDKEKNLLDLYTKEFQPSIIQALSSIAPSRKFVEQRPWVSRYSRSGIAGLHVHLDNSDFTCVAALNADFEGGGVYFPKARLSLRPTTGEFVCFSGRIPHRSIPVQSGQRIILVNFFNYSE